MKNGEMVLRWKKRKVKEPKLHKVKDLVCFDTPDYGDETRPE